MTTVTHHDRSPSARQQHQRGADEQLVRDRVEQLAEVGDLVDAAGEPAVEAVRGGREDEQRGRDEPPGGAVTAVDEQRPGEERDQRDAEHRERVRQVPGGRSEDGGHGGRWGHGVEHPDSLERCGGGPSTPLQSARDPPRPRRPTLARRRRPRDPAARRWWPRRASAPRRSRPADPTGRRARRAAPHGPRRPPPPTPTPTPTPTADPDAEFTIVAAGRRAAPPARPRRARRARRRLRLRARARAARPVDPGRRPGAVPPRGARRAAGHAAERLPDVRHPGADRSSLQAQGWDGCSTASNHSVDRGFAGVTATLDALDAAGLGHVGHRPQRASSSRSRSSTASSAPAGRSPSRTSPRRTARTACRSTPTSRGR